MSEFKLSLGDMDLTTNTIAYTMTMSREMALNLGAIEPTPEELAERNEKSRIFHDEQKAERVTFIEAIEQLREKGGLTAELLDLHAPDLTAQWSPECPGCDYSGYEGEPPEWPCRTVEALAAHHGITLPSHSLPGTHYEGEFVPSDGRVIEWPTPRWHFADLDDTPTASD